MVRAKWEPHPLPLRGPSAPRPHSDPVAPVRLLAVRVAALAVVVFLLFANSPNAQENSQPPAWSESDTTAVIEQWTAAAHAGDPRAMLALGRLYRIGLGTPRDPVQAFKWLTLAADRGESSAVTEIEVLSGIMTPKERAEGERLAREMQSAANQDAESATTAGRSTNVPAAVPPPREAIRESQVLLGELGYEPGPANGLWSPRTVEAYEAFLRDAGLPLADVLTPEGLLALRSRAGRQQSGSAAAASPTADSGSHDPPQAAVREAQELLAVLGYAPGPADGAWGRRTAAAYSAFLRDVGFSPANSLTPEGLLALRSTAGREGGGSGAVSASPAVSRAQAPPRAIVREAQELLAVLGYAPGPADGAWGRRSAQAYEAFLRDAGLRSGNALTPEGFLALRSTAGKEGGDSAPDSIAQPPPRAAVREAQELLAVLGHEPGPADGAWGRRSARAYADFLRNAGLPPVDALTPEGLLALRSAAERSEEGSGSGSALALTSIGQAPPRAAIREAQRLLAVLGYDPGPADGIWGKQLARAFAAFLRDAGLPPGELLTPELLLTMRTAVQPPGAEADAVSPSRPSPPLSSPEVVREAQELLTALGFAPGPVDGIWGRRSAEAYAAFLRDVGMTPSDTLSEEGLRALRVQSGARGSEAHSPAADVPVSGPPPHALHLAAAADDASALAEALASGEGINDLDSSGRTALMHAAEQGHRSVVELLLEAEADVDVRAPDGATALYMAAREGRSEIIRLLMRAGARVARSGPGNTTAAEVARRRYGVAAEARASGRDAAIVALLEGRTWAEAMQVAEEAERLARQWPAGRVFRDCAECPQMVVIPPGSFRMGSPADEEGRIPDEGPVRRVQITSPFAVGMYEVKREEYARFAEGTGQGTDGSCWIFENEEWILQEGSGWRNPGFSQGDSHPVVCVSWENARSYAEWLSRKTGEPYRLPSEAEWEYAARADTADRFHIGPAMSTELANFDGEHAPRSGRGSAQRRRTVSVGSFPANAYRLHDMNGNVWEWVEDCLHKNYRGAPADGSAWLADGDCSRRILRGGAWDSEERFLRSAARAWSSTDNRSITIGFRVARSLRPLPEAPPTVNAE